MDILDELKKLLSQTGSDPSADATVLAGALEEAIGEIERLRSIAGAVSPGQAAAEILAPLRDKAPSD